MSFRNVAENLTKEADESVMIKEMTYFNNLIRNKELVSPENTKFILDIGEKEMVCNKNTPILLSEF